MLLTPDRIRTLQRKLYCKAKQASARLTMKNIGKPCTEKPYARFDEGALMKVGSLVHAVAACGEAFIKRAKGLADSVLYSTHSTC